MMMLAAYTVMTGLLIGLRYRVVVLPPLILVGWLVIAAVSSQPWLSALIFAILLQISYLTGIVLRGCTTPSITQLADSISRPGTH